MVRSGKLCVWVEDALLWFYRQECRQSSPRNADLQGSRKQCTNNKIKSTKVPPLLFLSSCLEALVKLVAEDNWDVIGRVYASHRERYAD